MKIYFAGSISSGRGDAGIYHQIIEHLKTKGQVLTEHIGDSDLSSDGEDLSDQEIHDRDLGWVLEADCIVAEVTTPSLGVGYEIGRAVENGKKVLCLCQKQKNGRLSGMIAGSPEINTKRYDGLENAKEIIDKFFNQE